MLPIFEALRRVENVELSGNLNLSGCYGDSGKCGKSNALTGKTGAIAGILGREPEMPKDTAVGQNLSFLQAGQAAQTLTSASRHAGLPE